jgi:hypothetical protein
VTQKERLERLYYSSLKECLNLPINMSNELVRKETRVQKFEERMEELYLNTKGKEEQLNESE